jgi:hypothetical protein
MQMELFPWSLDALSLGMVTLGCSAGPLLPQEPDSGLCQILTVLLFDSTFFPLAMAKIEFS